MHVHTVTTEDKRIRNTMFIDKVATGLEEQPSPEKAIKIECSEGNAGNVQKQDQPVVDDEGIRVST